MKQKFYLIAASSLLAVALACGDKSPSPAAPSSASPGETGAGALADGTTLKVPAPTPVSPANGAQLTDFNVVLKVNPVTALFTNASTFAYRFQVLLNGQVVREVRTSAAEWKPPALEANNATHAWRCRAEQGTFFGPWSAEWTFKTPDQPTGYIQGGEVYDPLTDGKTVGIVHGPVTFIPGVGAKIENQDAYIEYRIPQTITGGEISMLVTNLAKNTEGGKTKLMSMREGDSDITTNDRRFTIEKRGNPPGTIAWRVITSRDQIDTVGNAQRMVRDFETSKLYLWRATWGGGRFNLTIKDGGADGRLIYSFGKAYRGVYDPSPHRAFVGGPQGRGGRDTGSVNDMIVRQVWVSSRERPAFANK
jgi:hypothetical protein